MGLAAQGKPAAESGLGPQLPSPGATAYRWLLCLCLEPGLQQLRMGRARCADRQVSASSGRARAAELSSAVALVTAGRRGLCRAGPHLVPRLCICHTGRWRPGSVAVCTQLQWAQNPRTFTFSS